MSVLLYYITDRSQFSGDESARRAALLAKIAEAGSAGVDYIQIREKDLFARELASLAQDAVRVLRNSTGQLRPGSPATRLLINSRSDIALTVGAEGVHLRSDDISPKDVRDLVARSGMPLSAFVIGSSCHSPEDVRSAESAGADFAVFAPVFEKNNAPHIPPSGLQKLADACRARIPVLALGGVTLDSAAACIEAGAAGIAAIRLFQDHPVADVVRALRR